jgi:hypothetical protein
MRMSKSELATEAKSSPVLEYMIEHHIALTRRNFLDLAYMGVPPAALGVEKEAALPRFLQNWKVRHAEGE